MYAKSLISSLEQQLNRLKANSAYKQEHLLESAQGALVKADGREMIMLASNNYLGLAAHPEVIAAAKAAYVDHFVHTLPDGYAMELNEESSNISQGQKQLLTIARAILADPRILILDEATSSVDTRTELLIQKAMDGLMRGRTSFVIAHRLSTIRNADLILVMNEGDIVEQGSHDELITRNGFYAELYNSQFEPTVVG